MDGLWMDGWAFWYIQVFIGEGSEVLLLLGAWRLGRTDGLAFGARSLSPLA